MASLKEIKGRIASVQSTQKITSAMRMVASAKLHHTQGITQNFLVYKQHLAAILESLGYQDADNEQVASASTAEGIQNNSSLSEQSETMAAPKSVLLIPVASNSGLCGAFNTNIAKATLHRIQEWKEEDASVTLMPIGKKIAHSLQNEGIEYCAQHVELLEKMGKEDIYPAVVALMNEVALMRENGAIDCVEFIYHHFKSMGSQMITIEQMPQLPLTAQPSQTSQPSKTPQPPLGGEVTQDYITEPSAAVLLQQFYPRVLNAKAYGIMLDSITSEHAARMLAMQTADDNAQELIQELTLVYNKTRQQSITNELIDIMSGKAGN